MKSANATRLGLSRIRQRRNCPSGVCAGKRPGRIRRPLAFLTVSVPSALFPNHPRLPPSSPASEAPLLPATNPPCPFRACPILKTPRHCATSSASELCPSRFAPSCAYLLLLPALHISPSLSSSYTILVMSPTPSKRSYSAGCCVQWRGDCMGREFFVSEGEAGSPCEPPRANHQCGVPYLVVRNRSHSRLPNCFLIFLVPPFSTLFY